MSSTFPDYGMLSTMFDALPIPVFIIDSAHRIILWNTAIEKFTGIGKNDVFGTTESWKAFYHKERPTLADLLVDGTTDEKIVSLYTQKCEKSQRIEGAFEAENYVRSASGETKWIHITASPIRDEDGTLIGAMETLEDVSQRKDVEDALYESEQSYRALFESAYDAIWVHDMNGYILAANEALSMLCGYPVEEMIGMYVKDFICGDNDVAVAREIKRKLLNGGRIDAPYEMTLLRKDGTQLSTIVTTNLVHTENNTLAFQNTARDVTNEKRMEEHLHYYLKQITRAQEEERKRIARELHDDTAQVLLSLSRQIDNFVRNERDMKESHQTFLGELQKQVNRAVQDVHRYAQDLRPSLIDDLGLMAALRSYAKRVREYDDMLINLKVTGEEKRLSSDIEMLLYRVIQEAMNNVWKHAEATEIDLTIEFGENNVSVCVSDNGKGFDISETMANMARTGKLGLIGMQERARLLGGILEFDSTPGCGTKVYFTLPY